MILAHPDMEHERLSKALLHMPINNPDNEKERFPKELPRGLFPISPDLKLRRELDESIMSHCNVKLPSEEQQERRTSLEKSPPPQKSVSLSQGRSSLLATVEDANDDDDGIGDEEDEDEEEEEDEEMNKTKPRLANLERERKPYASSPGRKEYPPETTKRAPVPSTAHNVSFASTKAPENYLKHSRHAQCPANYGRQRHRSSLDHEWEREQERSRHHHHAFYHHPPSNRSSWSGDPIDHPGNGYDYYR